MADPNPKSPTTSGRIAGIIAILAILLGGYFGFVVRPAQQTEPTAATANSEPPAPAKPAAPAIADASKPADGSSAPSAGSDTKSASTAPDAAPKPAEPAKPAPQQQAALTPPAAPAAPAATDNSKMPSFDIVRVEPSGSTVVAGTAEPKAKVEVLDGPKTIATAEANEQGQWAIDVTKPLDPGSHDLSIRTTSPDKKTETLSEQHVAVDVQKDGKSEPLVVLATPDAASKVLQKPAAVEGAPKVAAAPDASGSPATLQKQDKMAAATPTGPAPAAPNPATPDADSMAAKPAAPADAGAPPSTKGSADKMAEALPPAGTAAGSADASKPAMAPDKANSNPAGAPAPARPVTVDAVEFEGGKLFVAGSSATGAIIRVYLDDAIVGQTRSEEGGRWLLQAQHDVTLGKHQVRADQLEEGSGKVVVRAEVPFERTEDVAALSPITTAGAGANGAQASGTVPPPQTVIIRHGDNLWTISRRLYGRGIHYSTIYQANDEQIRNPHWIYPGQVFTLPVGDAKWTQ